jgi:hypothetical protein
MARKELERDFIIPDFTEIVGATVGQLMSTATETTMAHLSNYIFLSRPPCIMHARQTPPDREPQTPTQELDTGLPLTRLSKIRPFIWIL